MTNQPAAPTETPEAALLRIGKVLKDARFGYTAVTCQMYARDVQFLMDLVEESRADVTVATDRLRTALADAEDMKAKLKVETSRCLGLGERLAEAAAKIEVLEDRNAELAAELKAWEAPAGDLPASLTTATSAGVPKPVGTGTTAEGRFP